MVDPIDPAVFELLVPVKMRSADPVGALLETTVRKLVVPPVMTALVPPLKVVLMLPIEACFCRDAEMIWFVPAILAYP